MAFEKFAVRILALVYHRIGSCVFIRGYIRPNAMGSGPYEILVLAYRLRMLFVLPYADRGHLQPAKIEKP